MNSVSSKKKGEYEKSESSKGDESGVRKIHLWGYSVITSTSLSLAMNRFRAIIYKCSNVQHWQQNIANQSILEWLGSVLWA